MNCASCGSALPEGAAFCGNCGARVDEGVLRVTLDDTEPRPTAPTAVAAPPPPSVPTMTPTPSPPRYPPPMVPAPPVATGRPARSTAGMVGAIIGSVGAVVVIVGALLSWVGSVSFDGVDSFRIPFEYLLDYQTSSDTETGVGVLLVILAVAGLATSFIPKFGIVRNFCGGLVVVIAVLYLVQTMQVVDSLNFGSTDLGDWLGPGFYVTGVGGLLMAAAPPRWR